MEKMNVAPGSLAANLFSALVEYGMIGMPMRSTAVLHASRRARTFSCDRNSSSQFAWARPSSRPSVICTMYHYDLTCG